MIVAKFLIFNKLRLLLACLKYLCHKYYLYYFKYQYDNTYINVYYYFWDMAIIMLLFIMKDIFLLC